MLEDPIRPESGDQVTSAPGGAATRVYASELDGAHVLTDAVASYGAAPSGGLLSVKRDGAVVREVHIPSAGPHQIIFDPPLMGTTNEYLTVALGGGGGVVVGKLAVGHYVKPTRGSNRLKNGGFEMAGGGGADIWAYWTETAGDGATADETVLVHGGGHAAKITSGPSSNSLMDQYCAVVPQTKWTLRLWTRGDGTNAGRYYVYDNTGGAYIVPTSSTGVPGTVYTEVVNTFMVPAGCISIAIGFRPTAVNGGIVYFDDVSVSMVG